MKSIIKQFLFTVVLALIFSGCQKLNDGTDNQSSLMKSINTAQVPVSGAQADCQAVNSNCAYAYKIDDWNAISGIMDGTYTTDEGNVITIAGSDGHNFTWTSEWPVCAVIVKAGQALVVLGSGYSGTVNYDLKEISHVTFCYDVEKVEKVIAVKAYLWNGNGQWIWAGSAGSEESYIFRPTSQWCQYLGINYYPAISSFPLIDGLLSTHENVGTVTIEPVSNALNVTVTLKTGYLLDQTYLYVGDLNGLTNTTSDQQYPRGSGCPDYYIWPYKDDTNANSVSFIVPISQ